MLLLTVGYGASSIAGRDQDGELALVVALPLARGAILLQKVAAPVSRPLSGQALRGGTHTRTSWPSALSCDASATSGWTSPRVPIVDSSTRI
jgi:hypothetical protein